MSGKTSNNIWKYIKNGVADITVGKCSKKRLDIRRRKFGKCNKQNGRCSDSERGIQ